MKEFTDMFGKNQAVPITNGYEVYIAGAERIWNAYADKYRIYPRSTVRDKKGTNRGVEISCGDSHWFEVSIGLKSTTLYVYDDTVRRCINIAYEQDNAGHYRHSFKTFDECFAVLEEFMNS